MKAPELGDVIPTRELSTAGRPPRRVTVRMGYPRQEPTGDWVCPFQISGIGKQRVNAGHGVDAFQAIQNALEGIRFVIEDSGRELSWLDSGQHWFPRFVPQVLGPK